MSNATVTIENDKVKVEPDPLRLGNSPNVNIHWRIADASADAGWRFTHNGIVIPEWGGEFKEPEWKEKGKQFKWFNRNTPELKFKYSINVINDTKTLSLDPTIINRAGK